MDAMSSPDPLNASLDGLGLISSRRVTRSQSQASSRLSSVNPSPRKQTFALDVGDERSPQKILVTVEADDRDSQSSNVKRKLFQSPTPKRVVRRREKTTTTVVPLKGLTDDEGAAPSSSVAPTPKRRGRPQKSAGTPATAAKKKATPMRKTPGRTRRTKTGVSEDITSDISVPDPNATPKPTRPRTSTKRKNGTPAKEAGETPRPKRRGRPRRVAVTAEGIMVAAPGSDAVDVASEDDASVATGRDNASVTGSYASAPPSSHGGDDDDIWMATLSDPPTQQLGRHESLIDEQHPEGMGRDEARLPSVDRQTDTDDGRELHVDYGAEEGYSASEASDTRGDSVDKDTIMVQEDFTMISIHSLPSMQGNLYGSTSQYEIGDETSQLINQTLESLRQSHTESRPKTPYEDEVSFVGPSPEKSNSPMLASNSLLAPSAPPSAIRPSPRRAKAQDLARQLALKSLQNRQVAESPQRQQPAETVATEQVAEESIAYDDSFSEIPEAVLEAATPKPLRRTVAEIHEDSVSEIPEAVLDAATPRPFRQISPLGEDGPSSHIQPSIEVLSRPNPLDLQSESNRLLTPDETPSPIPSEDHEDKLQSGMKEHKNYSGIQSSPPVVNTHQRERSSVVRPSTRDSSETPAIVAVSSASPPRIQVSGAQGQILAPPESATRPTLSPIVRAGRALQMVTSDPPSPPARSPSLGSPFRASVSKSPAPPVAPTQLPPTPSPQAPAATQSSPPTETTSAAVAAPEPPSAEGHRNSPWSSAFAPFKQIKNLVMSGAQVFSSPRAAASPAVEHPSVAPALGIPPQERQDTLSMHNSMFRLGGDTMNPASRSSSVQVEVAYEDEMSWQAEEMPALRADELLELESSTGRARRGSDLGEMSDVDMESLVEESIVEDDEDGQGQEPGGDFDDDIWAVEAQLPTPGRPQASSVETEAVLNPPRRSKLPSPWRQNSKRLVYSDELHKLASETADQGEEFSLLSQLSGNQPPVPAQPAQQPKKVDLSAFFSSPALLPEVLPPGVSYPRPPQAPFAQQLERGSVLASGIAGSAEREAEEEPETPARAAPSVARRIFSFGRRTEEPHSSLTKAPSLPSVPQKELQIGGQPRVDLFSPMKPARGVERDAVEPSSSPATPPRNALPHIPQKMNFTPRSGQARNSLFAPVSREPSEIFSEDEDQAEVEVEETPSPQRYRSSPTQESSFIAPVLKPLPSRVQSPTKSCIRSPLKPKTPGRVVEFTSSTLSPIAQAQARAEQRSSSASRPSFAVSGDLDKENEPAPMDPSNAAPASKPQSLLRASVPHLPPPMTTTAKAATITTTTPRLSAKAWTRSHWERLDSLLQQRRASGALAFQLAHPVAPPKSTGSAQPTKKLLLGKQVVAQGESMTLEQWHLDVVEAFAAELGPGSAWDERVLAKRVFALLVGEERRRAGKVDRSSRCGEAGRTVF